MSTRNKVICLTGGCPLGKVVSKMRKDSIQWTSYVRCFEQFLSSMTRFSVNYNLLSAMVFSGASKLPRLTQPPIPTSLDIAQKPRMPLQRKT